MLLLRRALWVKVLTVILLLIGSIEMKKTGRRADGQFEPPAVSAIQTGLLEEYSQMEGWSHDEPPTEPWSPYDDNLWGDLDWSLADYDSYYGDIDDEDLIDDYKNNGPDSDDEYDDLYEEPKEAEVYWETDEKDDDFSIQNEPGEITGTGNGPASTSHTETGTDDEINLEIDTSVNSPMDVLDINSIMQYFAQRGVEVLIDMKDIIEFKSSVLLAYCRDIGSDYVPVLYIIDSLQVTIESCGALSRRGCAYVAKCIQPVVLKSSTFLLTCMHSVSENELIIILEEELVDPLHNSLVELFYNYTNPVVEYFSDIKVPLLSTQGNEVLVVFSKYLLKVKNLIDQTMSLIADQVSSSMQRCNNKECLLSTVHVYLHDQRVYYKLYWVAVYTIIAVFLVYSSYIANKAILVCSVHLIKLLVTSMITLLSFIFCCYRKSHLCKSQAVTSVGCYCAFDENRGSVSQNRYNELIEASERKVEQIKRILQLENQLEELKIKNMLGYFEMYQKQAELNGHM